MKTKFIEAENVDAGGFNWGKFVLAQFEPHEWAYRATVDGSALVRGRGWTAEHILVVDLQTGEGAIFRPGGSPTADLNKHAVWVCPMFEPFLAWLYSNWAGSLDKLPSLVKIDSPESSMCGYRRAGPEPVKPNAHLKAGRPIEDMSKEELVLALNAEMEITVELAQRLLDVRAIAAAAAQPTH